MSGIETTRYIIVVVFLLCEFMSTIGIKLLNSILYG